MKRLLHQSIASKIAVSLGAAFALVVLVGVAGLIQVEAVSSGAREVRQVWLPRAALLERVDGAISEHKLLATLRRDAIGTPDGDEMIVAKMNDVRDTLSVTLHEYRYTGLTDIEEKLFSRFMSCWGKYESAVAAALLHMEEGDRVEADRKFDIAITAFERARNELGAVRVNAERTSTIAVANADQVYSLGLYLTMATFLAAAVFGLLSILWASRSVSTPIMRVTEAMRKLTEGDLSASVPDYGGRTDEIGILAAAVEGYRDSLAEMSELKAVAERERARLHDAVENMPIGLSVRDHDGCLVVCNSRYLEIYDIPPEVAVPGVPLIDLLRARGPGGMDKGHDSEEHIRHRMDTLRRGGTIRDVRELASGRFISLLLQPLNGGGWLAIHEDVTEQRRSQEQIHHMARHDSLTDLPNRMHFNEAVETALKEMKPGENVAVFCLDLNRFKSVNDALGHPVGDALLRQAARRIRECVGESGCAGRLGGDEFAIVQYGVDQPRAATALAESVIAALCEPYNVDGHQVVVGASIGIAMAPGDGNRASDLLKNCDLALYRAKGDGTGSYHFFEPEMDAVMQARRALELDLRQALREGQFVLHYQPLISVETRAIVSFEALLRWDHPERGMVQPDEFIPLCEEIGLIAPLGDWVMRQACRDAASWPDHIGVAVNLSPAQFKGDKLLETVISAVAVSGIDPSRLQLEITENVLLARHASTVATLHKLRAYGVRISMDDFGTGHSSLSYLRSFPFDKIKIDRSFIASLEEEDNALAIVRAVTGMSTSMGMQTTAEGVETEDQFARIRQEGCTEAQGFLFAKAMPAGKIADYVSSWTGSIVADAAHSRRGAA